MNDSFHLQAKQLVAVVASFDAVAQFVGINEQIRKDCSTQRWPRLERSKSIMRCAATDTLEIWDIN
jgi:hypothetical protein